jgi:serine protease SohB
MEYLAEYGLFLAKSLTVVLALGVLAFLVVALSHRQQHGDDGGHIEVRSLNDRYDAMRDAVKEALRDPAMAKQQAKADRKAKKKEEKERAKAARKNRQEDGDAPPAEPRLFVLDFDGDLRASAVDTLREEVSALLLQMGEQDEVLLRLESGGGLVHSYGLAASQLLRIRDAGHRLTVSVDRVAASGGYMMACVADRIIAAPFAIIGSIGVIAQLPNFHRLLKKNDIDFELHTAGEYKRTLPLFGENTDKGREKFREELEDTHRLFKEFVSARRPALAIDRVATGEIWYGQQALDMQLVDALQTSDDFIQKHLDSYGVFEVEYLRRRSWQQKLGLAAEDALERSVLKLWRAGTQRPPA